MVRHAHRRPYPRTQQNTATLPIQTRPTDGNKLHNTTLGQNHDATDQHRHGGARCINNLRRNDHRQQRNGSHANQADDEAAKTTANQQHRSCSRHLTVNRPHASRPTPNQPGVHGSKRERRPKGWRHRGAPRPPTTMPTNKTWVYHHATDQPTLTELHRNRTIRPTNRPQRPTSNPQPPGRAQARPSQEV